MSFLVDTNVLSELRKGRRADPGVLRWFGGVEDAEVFTSVVVVGEIVQRIESVRRRDARSARSLEKWLRSILAAYSERVLPVDVDVAQRWGELNAPDRLPAVDSLIAATALVHGLTVVTRNSNDFERAGVQVLNPFDP